MELSKSTHKRAAPKPFYQKDWYRLFMKLRWKAARALVPRVRVSSRGLRFTLQCDNWITYYRWKSYNNKEPETLDWIDRWVRDGDTIFDIGANIGVYSIYAALRHPKARVISFEPEYANLHLLRDNVVGNALQDRIGVYSVALSSEAGLSTLYIQDLTPGSAHHTAFKGLLGATVPDHPILLREGIYNSTLDDFCDESGLQPNCLKLDVDGSELAVLEGGLRTMGSPSFRSLIVELLPDAPTRERCVQLLQELGLRCHRRDGERSDNEIWVREATP